MLFDTPEISRCRSQHVVSVESSSLFHHSIYLRFICFPWWSIDGLENLHAGRTTVCFEPWQKPRARLGSRKTGLSPPVIFDWLFQGGASGVVHIYLLSYLQCLLVAWPCGHSKTVRIAICIVFCFVQASTVTTSLQYLLTLLSVRLNVLFYVSHFRSYYSLFLSYNRSWGRGEGGIPLNRFKLPPPQYFNTDRSKAVLLLWFLTVTCSCCPYLYFGSAVMLVTYFSKF